MKKVMVTKAEMEAIERQRDNGVTLNAVLIFLKNHKSNQEINKQISSMSVEQIVLAWHGYAEIEKEYASFDEAMKASDEGKIVDFYSKEGNLIPVNVRSKLKDIYLSDYSLRDLREGRFIIGDENR